MKAVVHIGLPKTGTTSIQNWLLLNQEALVERGVGYDRVVLKGVPQRSSQAEFGICGQAEVGQLVTYTRLRKRYQLDTLEKQKKFAQRFEAALTSAVAACKADTFIISSEHICMSLVKTPEHLRGLETFLRRHFDDVRYLLYIRRQEDWLLSRYSQIIRRGGSQGLNEYLRENPPPELDKLADLWSGAVGRDKFTIRLLEPDALVDGDLITDFAHAVGFDASGLPRPPRLNESLSIPSLEFLRILNKETVPMVNNGRRRNPLVKGLEKRLGELTSAGHKLVLGPKQIASIRQACAEGNERLRAAYFPERPQLFPPRPSAEDPDRGTNLPTPDEMAFIGVKLFMDLRMGGLKPLSNEEIDWIKAAQPQLAEKRSMRKKRPKEN